MATKTRARNRSAGRAARTGGRITGGRGAAGRAGRGRSAAPSGPMGLLSRITSTVGRSGGRGASQGGGLASQASSFVRGFMGSGGRGGRRR